MSSRQTTIQKKMKQLSKAESFLFLFGGLLMVVGAGLYAFLLVQKISSVVFLVGAILFVAMQLRQRYLGSSITIRRLRRIMGIADVCFVLAGLLMVEQCYGFFAQKLMGNLTYLVYLIYAARNWVVLLLIGALLEMYTTHRISGELQKEEDNTEKTLKE